MSFRDDTCQVRARSSAKVFKDGAQTPDGLFDRVFEKVVITAHVNNDFVEDWF